MQSHLIGIRRYYRQKTTTTKKIGYIAIMQASDNALGMKRPIRLERFLEDKVDNICEWLEWKRGL